VLTLLTLFFLSPNAFHTPFSNCQGKFNDEQNISCSKT